MIGTSKYISILITLLLWNTILYSQEVVTDTIYQEVVIQYDTIYAAPDTVQQVDTQIVYIEPLRMNYRAISFSSSFLYGNTSFTGRTETLPAEIMNTASQQFNGYSLNLDYSVVKNNLLYGVGIGLSAFREKLTFSTDTYLTNSVEYTRLDTIDERYQVTATDTIWEYVTQLNTYTQTDSSVLASPYNNRYTIIAIPLSFGYVFPMYSYEWYLKGSIYPALLIGNKNNIIVNDEGQWRYRKSDDLLKLNLSYSLELGIMYPIGERWFVTPSLQFRNSISSFYSEQSGLKLKSVNWGVKVGVQYRL